ncbi:MAG: (2Fe-2S)-binding protein [Myxococcales bacterium]|nr:(2Fe-2S)-binding protein [Myxococcales bacterium]
MKLALTVNGKKRKVDVPPMKRLLDTLREDLGLTGTKEGCGEGECGACTVLIDGEAVNSCLVPTLQVARAEVVTIEGLAASRGKRDNRVNRVKLHKLQSAFLECGGAQCGICTPGMIVAAAALPKAPSREEIRVGLAGNLCRCTGYMKIYDAVESALGSHKKSAKRAPRNPKARAKVKA